MSRGGFDFRASFTANFAPARKKKVAEGRLGARTPTRTANCRRQPHGQPHGRQTLKRTKVPLAWGLTCGYFRDLWTEKSKLASMLVFWSPRGAWVPMAWGGCVGTAGYPMGCQVGRLTRHETPLARPSQATKISKPNRFAYPFRSRPRRVCGPPILNLRPHHTSSYRGTANLGLGVRPRRR